MFTANRNSVTIKEYEIVLKTQEPFRVGGVGDPLSEQGNPIAIIGDRVVIPGPSLKGRYRAELERYLIEEWSGNELMKPCIPSSESKLSLDEKVLTKSGKYRVNGSCTYPPKGEDSNICPVCYLLGAQGLFGFVRVPFLECTNPPEDLYSARIDRGTLGVAKGTNRPYQVVPKDTTFSGKLSVLIEDKVLGWTLGQDRKKPNKRGERSLLLDIWVTKDDWTQEKILSELIVKRLENITELGGFKSKGCGKVTITVREIA
jgi:CRISPR/Cas system CSM-associated protein Csm3 (group 7 of RAMP superfamily)